MMLFTILGVGLFVAVLAAAFAFAANILFKRASVRRRASGAAAPAGLLPIVPGLIALGLNADSIETLLPIAALLIGGVILTAVVAFPVAYLVAKRRPDPISTGTFE